MLDNLAGYLNDVVENEIESSNIDFKTVLLKVVEASYQAGKEILDVYNSEDFDVEFKNDDSPLTRADKCSHNVLVGLLGSIVNCPILSEEGKEIDWNTRKSWGQYWLIDPLDGTKEFVKRNGEFTVNVALIENQVPVLGVVFVPVKNVFYFGANGLGAHKLDNAGKADPIAVRPVPKMGETWKIIGSRSHSSEDFEKFIGKFDSTEIVSMGSSLKLCLVADGSADLYPRLGLTSEWDTAAAQAVVEAAGGQVINMESGEPLRYNTKESILNPFFTVCAQKSSQWYGA